MITIQICPDCAQVCTNGTDEVSDASARAYYSARYDNEGKEPTLIREDDGQIEVHFSKSPCDWCGDEFAGERISAWMEDMS
jgi:hypothetical protein